MWASFICGVIDYMFVVLILWWLVRLFCGLARAAEASRNVEDVQERDCEGDLEGGSMVFVETERGWEP